MNKAQACRSILMIRPHHFHFNSETCSSNAYMQNSRLSEQEQNYLAQQEFDQLADLLCTKGVQLEIVQDTPEPHTPDSLFPNNWLTMQHNGLMITYPMEASNRRLERKTAVLEHIKGKYQVNQHLKLEYLEQQNYFLEGTGSLVFDHQMGIAYACLSSRTMPEALDLLAKHIDYRVVAFHGYDQHNQAIYHTNVMMSVGSQFIAVCLDAVTDKKESANLLHALESSNKTIIPLSRAQIASFSGNILELKSYQDQTLIAMSESAWQGFNHTQQKLLESFGDIVFSPIPTIERHAGGSVRCMLAEIFLNQLEKK